MPDKSRNHATEQEQRVVEEVEQMIERRPNVLKTLQALNDLETNNTRENRDKYTVQKNRISAQLSRDRRSAIVQSLMELCVTNFEKRDALERDLEDAKDILQKTLCGTCKDGLRKRCSKPKKSGSGITVKGKGNAFILSILALSVAMVTVYNPNDTTNGVLVPQNDMDFELEAQSVRRNLDTGFNMDNAKALQIYEPESEAFKLQ